MTAIENNFIGKAYHVHRYYDLMILKWQYFKQSIDSMQSLQNAQQPFCVK